MSKVNNRNTTGVKIVYKKSWPLTNENSLLFLEEVCFSGELSIGKAYETKDDISTVYVMKKKKEKDHRFEKVMKNIN